MARDSNICCCNVSVWCQVIAWLEIIAGAIGAIAFAAVLATVDSLQVPKEHNAALVQGVGNIFKILMGVMLAFSLMSAAIGAMLLYGTTKANVACLWVWIVLQTLGFLTIFVFRIVEATYVGFYPMVPLLIASPLFGFLVWLVLRRIRDIKTALVESPPAQLNNH